MSTDKLLSLYILDKRNLDLAPSSKANLIIVSSAVTKPEGVITTPNEVLFLISFCYVIALAIFILMLLDVGKVAIAKIAILNPFCKFPCSNCRFFTNNYHLLCAVHPSIVFTKQAFDCSDYHPLSNDLS